MIELKLRKTIALILSLIMMATLCQPLSIFAASGTTIMVESAGDIAGATVVLDVVVENNPGISAAVITFTYDEGLEALNVTNGEAFSCLSMTTSKTLESPFKVTWDGETIEDEDIKDGVIASIEFKIPDDAVAGTIYNVSAACTDKGISDNNLNPVSVNIVNGSIEVKDFTYGDLNSDRTVDNIDTTLLRRHIAGGYEQTIKEEAADVNTDGEVNATDTVLVRRFIAGGWGVTFPYIQTGCNHILEKVPAKEATESEEGNIEYWHCKVCNKYFSDDKGANEIPFEETVIRPIPKSEYTIQYKCDMVPLADDTYKYGIEKLLPVPVLDKYTFVGWSDKNGKIWETIPVGTTGDLILYANWSSDRNKAIPVENLSEPTIMKDSQNGLIYFSYNIGKIVNVPLYEMSEILTANGVETTIKTTKSTSQKVQTSQEIAKTLSEATTNSTSWALSKDWNEVTEVSEKYIEENKLDREITESLAKNSAGSYTVGYQSGGTDSTVNISNSAYAISNNDSHHREFENQNAKSVVETVDHKFNAEAGASFPISVVDVNVKLGYNYQNNEVTTTSSSNKYAGTDDWSSSMNYNNSKSNTSSSSKSWNSTSNATNSWGETKTNSVKNAISEMVAREYNTEHKYELGGSESNTIGKSTVTGEENKLSSTILYDTTNITTNEVEYKTTGNTHGGYRIVLAGTLQVYAVVIYDIATKEYSVQTYSVLGDGSHNDAPKPYLDYSWVGNQFDDYQHSVLPFEIPYEVNGYVNSLVAATDGLKFDPDEAEVTGFNNDLGSELVYVPTYISVDNGDGTYSFTEIKSLSKDLFKNKTDIKAVRLGNGITEIPEGAFEGCTNLTDIYAPNVTKIGSRAFAGCKNLNKFTISEDIIYIGSEAFDGVQSIDAMASSVEVAEAVARSGSKNVVLNISKIPEDKRDNIGLNIGQIEKFELRGENNMYPGLSIVSDAKTTVLNRITFTQNTKTPITLSSENVTLDQVTVDCIGYALVLKADNTKLSLNRTTNELLSSTGIAAISKNIAITEMDGSSFESGLRVKGDILVFGSYSGDDLVEFNSGEFKVINDEDEYENYLTLRKVTFDANGGMLGTEPDYKMVPYNGVMGELPTASRDYFTFDGWYTEAEGGELITEESLMTSSVDITLYAHWVDNDVSEWVLESEMPADAEIVNTKYTYLQTSYDESTSPSLNGYECYDSYWVESGRSSFNYANLSSYNCNGWYGDFRTDRLYNAETSTYKRVTDAWHTGYIYLHWCLGRSLAAPSNSLVYRHPTDRGSVGYCGTFHSFTSAENKTQTDGGGVCYKWSDSNLCPDAYYWFKEPYYTCSYTEYYKMFKHRKTEEITSETYPSGNNISNIQEWVQYRAK